MTKLYRALRDGDMSRRDLFKTMGALGIGFSMIPVMGRQARAAEQVTYYTWAGYDVPQMHQPFIDANGADALQFSIFADESEALGKLRTGFRVDTAHPCIYDTQRWRDAGVIEPLDTGKIEAWNDLFPELINAGKIPGDENTWLVPVDWGNGSILYRTDMVEGEPDSWELLFDPKYKGRLAVWGGMDGVVNVAGLVAGVKDLSNMTDEELSRVRKLLTEQKALLRFYWDDPTQFEQAMAAGEIVASYAWNAGLVNMRNQVIPVKYMNPKEGILTWVCGITLVKSGEASEQARYDFINSVLSPEVGKFLIGDYGYGHSNSESFKLAGPEMVENAGLPPNPQQMFDNSVVLGPMDPAVRSKYVSMLEEVKSGF